MCKAYSSNLTMSQYELIAPVVPAAKTEERPRSVSIWAVSVPNSIWYLKAANGEISQEIYPVGQRYISIIATVAKVEPG